MNYVSGEILACDGLQRGYLGFQNKIIVETGKGVPPGKSLCKGLIVPTLVNAHTHIGDSFIKKKDVELPKNVEELVAPPHGLKHKLLGEASESEIINGMRESIDLMIKTGVTCFCDFRENGMKGVNLLKKGLKGKNISTLVLSRPHQLKYDREEVELLLKDSHGIGLSSISDWDYSELEKIVKHVKRRGKMFAIHASERVREDIDLVLNLKPDFLVHMVCATEQDLERVKDNDMPVIVCPRSNVFYGLKPNFELMKRVGIDITIGTDNAMLNPPSVLEEVKYLKNMSKEFSIWELLYMITFGARKALNLDYNILGPNSPSEFIVLDGKTLKPLYISIN